MKRYFDHLRTLSEVKAEYKRLVKINHPDVGGDTATMQAINAQYAEAVKRIARNGEGRDRENAAFERAVEKPRRRLSLARKAWANRKTTRYFTCKGCGQVLSVPRGKGTLRVVCPKCKTESTMKS